MDTSIRQYASTEALSNEMLEQIFEEYVNSEDHGKHLQHFAPLKLGRVCKGWHAKINTMPRLWTTVYMMPPKCQEAVTRFETILSRTASLPIHLFFFDAGVSGTLSAPVTGPLVSALRGAIVQHAHQLATLDVEMEDPPDWLPPRVLELFDDCQYPNIAKVRLSMDEYDMWTPRFQQEGPGFWYSFAEDSHHLKELSANPGEWLLGYGLTVSKCYSWEHITRLDLRDVSSLRSILSPLRRCVDLEYLNITYSDDCDQSEDWLEKESLYRAGAPLILELPHLQELRIQFFDRSAATMFDALTLPKLKVLALRWFRGIPFDDRQATYDALNRLIIRSRCQGLTLDLDYADDFFYEAWPGADYRLRKILLKQEIPLFGL